MAQTRVELARRLERATDVRMKRARLKRELKAGRVTFEALLKRTPSYLKTARVFTIYLAVPGVGAVTAERTFRHAQILPSTTFADITERQCRRLLRELPG